MQQKSNNKKGGDENDDVRRRRPLMWSVSRGVMDLNPLSHHHHHHKRKIEQTAKVRPKWGRSSTENKQSKFLVHHGEELIALLSLLVNDG